MACETAVVASAVGGIPGVVVDGETGLLIDFEAVGGDNFEPRDPAQFARDLAGAINELMAAPERRAAMGRRGRARVEHHFSWRAVAAQTLAFYERLVRG